MAQESWYNKNIDFTKVNNDTWTKDEIPYPNPNVTSYTKLFKRFRNIPVTLWFGENDNTKHFTVRAGANSDYSYTGCCYPLTLTLEEMMNFVDEKFKNGTLIH
jgi:hypothetical protein